MVVSGRWPGPLTRAFLARFFEAESGDGSHDLRATFIWMMAALAAPGFVLPILLVGWDWSVIGLSHGFDVLRQISRADKALYVGFGMTITGLVGALVWPKTLIDRRDALVLGVLPVRPGQVVLAKLASLAVYVLVISAAMHSLASLTFGAALSTGGIGLTLRGVAAHFAASFLASVFVLVGITTVQAILALVAGPRGIARLAAWIQAVLVATMLLLLVSLPSIATGVARDLAGATTEFKSRELRVLPGAPADVRAAAVISPARRLLPPVWFFAVYESILGTDNADIRRLARRGLWSVVGLTLATVVVLPLAYRRMMAGAVQMADGATGARAPGVYLERLTRAISQAPVVRGLIQFLLISISRVPRHRFVVAAAIGVNLAWTLPVLLRLQIAGGSLPSAPPADLTSLGLSIGLCLLVATRLAAALPADARAEWLFDAAAVPTRAPAEAMRRTMIAVAAAPSAIVFSAIYLVVWGVVAAIGFLIVAAAAAIVATEVLLVGYRGVPGAHAWQSERSLLRRCWPLYGATALWCVAMPSWALTRGAPAIVVAIALLAILWWIARVADRGLRLLQAAEDAAPVPGAFQVLGLD